MPWRLNDRDVTTLTDRDVTTWIPLSSRRIADRLSANVIYSQRPRPFRSGRRREALAHRGIRPLRTLAGLGATRVRLRVQRKGIHRTKRRMDRM